MSVHADIPTVYVMMATYNGEKYLCEQIESILSQKDVNVTLRISDDCSMDNTMELLRKYADNNSNMIVTQNTKNLGVALNFMQMVYEVDYKAYDYYAFSDQDDVWLPEKMLIAIRKIKNKEQDPSHKELKDYGIPVLYCSDLVDVDADLTNPRRELAKIRLSLTKRGNPLVRNWFSGCTMVFNQELAHLANYYKLNNFPRIHDVWMFLVAFYCANVIVDMHHALILRRITGDNIAGELNTSYDIRRASIRHLKKPPTHNICRCAKQLFDGYKEFIDDKDKQLISAIANYAASPRIRLQLFFSSAFRQPSLAADFLMRVKFLLGRF
jgi:rhamnosyltransferase